MTKMKTKLSYLVMIMALLFSGVQAMAQCDAPAGYEATAINGQCWLDRNTPAPDNSALWTKAQLNDAGEGICPEGWRLPTLKEFSDAASALVSGGYITASDANKMFFWTAENLQGEPQYRILYFENCDYTMLYDGNEEEAYAVRCVKDGPPVVETIEVNPILNYLAVCKSEVLDEGTPHATVRGVCYSSTHNIPDLTDNVTTDGAGLGEYFSTISPLTPATTYYVRAYATNAVGTAYGRVLEFTTPEDPCGGITSVDDHDGNRYDVVAVGTQCWTKQNMRCTSLPSGQALATSVSEATYTPFHLTQPVSIYGWSSTEHYYNWAAATDFSPLTNAPYDYNAAGVRGICPEGWHLPTAADWDVMTNYLMSVPFLVCGSEPDNVAKDIAATQGWISYKAYDCHPGNSQESNNITGFAAYPAGWYNSFNQMFQHQGANAYFWTSTQGNGSTAESRSLSFDYPAVGGYSYFKHYAMSVRCLKNE